MFNTTAENATKVADFFFEAPAAALQQTLVNQVGYLGDILNGNIGEVFTGIGGNLKDAFQAATFFGQAFDFSVPSTLPLLLQSNDAMHAFLASALPVALPEQGKELITGLLNFASSPASGVLMGAVGPVISPVVPFLNPVLGLLDGDGPATALQGLLGAPLDAVNAFFNGDTLSLNALTPLINSSGLLPSDVLGPGPMELDSLSLAFGGLFSPGSTAIGVGGDVGGAMPGNDLSFGGSIFNSLGLGIKDLPNAVTGQGVGPIGALANLSQMLAGALGWDGAGNPLTDLTFPTLGTELFSGLGGGDFGLTGLTDGFQELAAGLFDGFELGAFTDVFGNLGDLPGLFLEIPQLIIDALLGSF